MEDDVEIRRAHDARKARSERLNFYGESGKWPPAEALSLKVIVGVVVLIAIMSYWGSM